MVTCQVHSSLRHRLWLIVATVLTLALVLSLGVGAAVADATDRAVTAPAADQGGHTDSTAGGLSPSSGTTLGGQAVEIAGAEHLAVLAGSSLGGVHVVAEDGALYDWVGGSPRLVTGDGLLTGRPVELVTAPASLDQFRFTVALLVDGSLLSWGSNNSGQLGDGTTNTSSAPVEVTMSGALAGAAVVDVVAGKAHVVTLMSDGRVVTWGRNTSGQLGDGTETSSAVPVEVDLSGLRPGQTVVSVAAGGDHSALVTNDGMVYAWGENSNGQLGDGTRFSSPVPKPMTSTGPGAITVEQAALAEYHSVVRTVDGRLYSVGYGYFGQLGTGVTGAGANTRTLVAVDTSGVLGGKVVVDVSVGGHRTSAVASDGTVYSWGRDYPGDGSADGVFYSPVAVDTSGAMSGAHAVAVTVTVSGTHVLARDGTVYGWGTASLGNAGIGGGSAVPVESPPLIASLVVGFGSWDSVGSDVRYDAATGRVQALTPSHTSAVVEVSVARAADLAGGAVVGEFTFGTRPQLIDQPQSHSVLFGESAEVSARATGDREPDLVWEVSTDREQWDRVDDGAVTESTAPSLVDGVVVEGRTTSTLTIESVRARFFVRAVAANGLGDGTTSGVATISVSNPPVSILAPSEGQTSAPAPLMHGEGTPGATVSISLDTVVQGTTQVNSQGIWLFRVPSAAPLGERQVTATQDTDGSRASMAVKVAGHAVATWGDGLAQSDGPAVLGERRVVQVSGGGAPESFALAVTDEGRVHAWGNGSEWPTDVPESLEAEEVVQVAAGHDVAVALTAQGEVLAWGSSSSEQPSAPDGLDGRRAVEVAAGGSTAYAILDDGSVVAWGDDSHGQATLPAALDAASVVQVDAGGAFAVARASDRTVHAWGSDDAHQTRVPDEVQGRTVAVTAGRDFAAALLDDGRVVAWGRADLGQTDVPPTVQGSVQSLDAGDDFVLALVGDAVVGWGSDADGRLDVPDALSSLVVTQVAAGGAGGLALVDLVSIVVPGDSRPSIPETELSGRAAHGTSVSVERVVGGQRDALGDVQVGADGQWSLPSAEPLDLGEVTFAVTSVFGSTAQVTTTVVRPPGAAVRVVPRARISDHLPQSHGADAVRSDL